MIDKKELAYLTIASTVFLTLMWGVFYWFSIHSYIDMAFLLLSSIFFLAASSVVEYDCDSNWILIAYIFILFIVFVAGCYLLSGTASFVEFANKYFIDIIAKWQL